MPASSKKSPAVGALAARLLSIAIPVSLVAYSPAALAQQTSPTASTPVVPPAPDSAPAPVEAATPAGPAPTVSAEPAPAAVAAAETAAPAVTPPEVPPAAPALPVSETKAPQTKGFDGFKIESENGDYGLKIGGIVQGDARLFLAGKGTDTLAIRRARIDLRANLTRYFLFRLQPDFSGGKLTLYDAYATLHLADELELQIGKMKSPIGLELLQSARDLLFAERGLPSALVPNRDVGVVIQGQAFDGALSYTMGIFNGAPDGTHNDEDENSAKDYEGRLFVKPFAFAGPGPLSGLGVGVAGSYGRQKGTLPTYRTPGRQTFFSYASTATADGVRTRVSPQAYYYVGPIGLTAEYVRSAQQVSDGTLRNRITFTAWQAAGSVVLGGKADYKGAKVTAPFDPGAGQWGALEVGLRYGQLRTDTDAYIAALADPATAARIANNFGAVANWWLSTGNRLLLGLDHTSFVGGASTGNRASETVFVTRLQGAL